MLFANIPQVFLVFIEAAHPVYCPFNLSVGHIGEEGQS